MIENKDVISLQEELISLWTDDFQLNELSSKALPDYLKNHFLINQIAAQSNTVIQIFDMANFKTIYTSPNCLEVTGFTADDLNNFGFTYWIKNIPLKEILFFIKSAKFVNGKLKELNSENLYFSNQCINMHYKNKAKESKSMVTINKCIEWQGKKQRFQLVLWRDMTDKFKSKDFSVRYQIGNKIYHYYSNLGKFKVGELLSEKEFVILKLHGRKNSTKEIAKILSLSHYTIDNHKKNIMNKLQTSSMDNVLEILNFIRIE